MAQPLGEQGLAIHQPDSLSVMICVAGFEQRFGAQEDALNYGPRRGALVKRGPVGIVIGRAGLRSQRPPSPRAGSCDTTRF